MGRRAAFSIALAAVVFAIYLPSFPAAFHYDDYPLMLEDPGVSGEAFPWESFLSHYGGRPLTLLSFHLDHRWAGEDPSHFHAVSVLLHAAAAVLLLHLLMRLGIPEPAALLAALLFAVHPSQVQAVNYVWSRSVLLMAVFSLAAILASFRLPALSLILYQLALFSRFEALALSAVLWRQAPRLRLPLALVSAGNVVLFLSGFMEGGAKEVLWRHSDALSFLARAPGSFWRYLTHVLFAPDQSIVHAPTEAPSGMLLVAGLQILVLGYFLYQSKEKIPALAYGVAWFLLWLLPSLLIPNRDDFNESRSYLAAAGLYVPVALGVWLVGSWALNRVLRSPASVPLRFAALSLLLAGPAAALTLSRHAVWRDDVRLWEQAMEAAPRELVVNYNLGAALCRAGRISEAREAFLRAVGLNPRDELSYAGLGFCAESEGDWNQALEQYDRALRLDPDNLYARQALERLRRLLASGGSVL